MEGKSASESNLDFFRSKGQTKQRWPKIIVFKIVKTLSFYNGYTFVKSALIKMNPTLEVNPIFIRLILMSLYGE